MAALPERILIIEDDPCTGEALQDTLSKEGFSVLPTPYDGETLARIQEAAPSLVILDLVRWPEGYRILEQLRAQESLRRLPVIALTPAGSRTAAAAALDKGADDFVSQPFDAEELLIRVRASLRRRGCLALEAERSPRLEVRLFGPLRTLVDGELCIDEDFTRRKVKALFGYLYLRRGKLISKDELMEALWPEVEDPNPGRLKQLILILRDTLEPQRPSRCCSSFILEKGGYYYFNTSANCYSDVEEFERCLTQAKRCQVKDDKKGALAAYLKAVGLHAGELLTEFRYEDWAAEERARLKEAYLEALQEAAALCADEGDYLQAISLLKKAVLEDKLREGAYVDLMRCLWKDGKRTEALRVYERLKAVLAEEMGVEPDTSTTRLYQRIRAD